MLSTTLNYINVKYDPITHQYFPLNETEANYCSKYASCHVSTSQSI